MKLHVKILCGPLWRYPRSSIWGGGHKDTRFKTHPGNRVRGNIVATTVTSTTLPETGEGLPTELGESVKAGGLCYSQSHALKESNQFSGKGHKRFNY